MKSRTARKGFTLAGFVKLTAVLTLVLTLIMLALPVALEQAGTSSAVEGVADFLQPLARG